MAGSRDTGDLFIKVGLNLDAVDKGLVYLNKAVPENIKALNEKIKQIKLKTDIAASEIDTSTAKGSNEYLKVQYHSLSEIIKMHQQIVNLREAEYKAAVKTSGIDSESAQKALTSQLESAKQKAEVQKQLSEITSYLKLTKGLEDAEREHRAKSLADAISNSRAAFKSNNRWSRENSTDTGKLQNVASAVEKVTSTFNELSAATSSVGGTISKTLEIFGAIPAKVGAAGVAVAAVTAALIALPAAGKKVQEILLDLADPAMKAGDGLYAAATGAQMTISAFAEFSRVCKVTGININEVTEVTKKLHAALIRTESGISGTAAASSKLIVNTLKQYGVEIRKENGELKNAYEISKSLAEGLQKAQEQGRGKDFLTVIGASGDFATYLEDLKGNIELEKTIVKNQLADATLAHNAQGYLNALNLQKDTLSNAFSSALVPVAYDILPKLTEQFGRLTEIINENGDAITAIGEIAGGVAVKLTSLGVTLAEVFAKGGKFLSEELGIGQTEKNNRALIESLKEKYGQKLGEVSSVEDYLKLDEELAKDIQFYKSGEALKAKDAAIAAERAKLKSELEKLNSDAEKKLQAADEIFNKKDYPDDWSRRSAKARYESEITKQLRQGQEELIKFSHIAESKIEGNFNLLEDKVKTFSNRAKTEFEYFSKWKNTDDAKEFFKTESAEQQSLSLGEQEAHLTRLLKLQEELQKMELDAQFGNNRYEKSLAELEIWKDKQLQAIESLKTHHKEYAEERELIDKVYAEKSAAIEREKANRLAEIRQSANSHFRTDLQNQLDAIEKQKDDWISAGMDEAEAETLAQREKADAISKFNAEVAKNLDSIWQSSLEKRLSEIEREKQAWIQKGIDEVKATQWAEQAKADAQKSAAMEVLKNNLKEYRAFQEGGYEGLKNYQLNQLAKNGIHFSDLDMTPQQLADFKKAQQIAQNSLLPNFMTEKDRQFELSQTLKSKIEEQERRRAEAEKWAAGIMVDGKPTAPKQFYDMFGALPDEALENLKQQLENAGNAAENFQQQLDAETETPPENIDAPFEDLSSKIENVNSNFDDLTPTIENISSNFDDISATIENLSSEFDNLTATLENVNGNFENLAAVLENIGQSEEKTPQLPQTENPATPLNINDLISVFDVMKPTLENLNGNFGELSPTLENVNSYFSELTPQIQNASNYFGGLSENALSATEAFSHLAEKINALDLSLKSSPEITNNVTINEAHAWDYSHIQELAEKVADVITPKILSAIGGNSNGY